MEGLLKTHGRRVFKPLIRRKRNWRDALRRSSKIGVRIRTKGKFFIFKVFYNF
jgi:hypothetical protein